MKINGKDCRIIIILNIILLYINSVMNIIMLIIYSWEFINCGMVISICSEHDRLNPSYKQMHVFQYLWW